MILRSCSLRLGAASKLVLTFLASLIFVALLVFLVLKLWPDSQLPSTADSGIKIYCAYGVAAPVEELVKVYNAKFGTDIRVAGLGRSGELVGQINAEFQTGVVGGADIYITADKLMLDIAHDKGIVSERFSLARQKPVIATATKNNYFIASIDELTKLESFKFGIASEQAAIGRMARDIARRDGAFLALEAHKAPDSEDALTLAQALITGHLDAAIIWDTTVAQVNQQSPEGEPPLKILSYADPTDQFMSIISIGIISTSKQPTECLRFARFLTAPETGKKVFQKSGFVFIEGDHWEESP